MSKIFTIGLPKTGTSSVGAALEILGFPLMGDPFNSARLDQFSRGDFSLPAEFQAFGDAGISPWFAEFNGAYPDAKFILTVRYVEPWIDSFVATQGGRKSKGVKIRGRSAMAALLQHMLDGSDSLRDRKYLCAVYEQHEREVVATIAHDRLLVYSAEEGWRALCAFLGVPRPSVDFPRENPR